MNDFSNQTAGETNGTQSDQSQHQHEGRPLNSVLSAVREGAQAAKAAAMRAVPKVKAAVSEADYWGAYGISYAAVFSWTVLKELTPDSVSSGVKDGVVAGANAATTWVEKMKQKKSEASTPAALLAPPVENAQPGTA